jgi:hypothetical protein
VYNRAKTVTGSVADSSALTARIFGSLLADVDALALRVEAMGWEVGSGISVTFTVVLI